MKEEVKVKSGSEEGDKRGAMKEESKPEEEQGEEEEEEGVRMAQESLKEVCRGLSTLETPQTGKNHEGKTKGEQTTCLLVQLLQTMIQNTA